MKNVYFSYCFYLHCNWEWSFFCLPTWRYEYFQFWTQFWKHMEYPENWCEILFHFQSNVQMILYLAMHWCMHLAFCVCIIKRKYMFILLWPLTFLNVFNLDDELIFLSEIATENIRFKSKLNDFHSVEKKEMSLIKCSSNVLITNESFATNKQ